MVITLFFLFIVMGVNTNASIQISCENVLHEQADAQSPMIPTALVGKPFTIKIKTEGNIGNKSLDTSQLPPSCTIVSSGRSTSINMFGSNVQSSTQYTFDVIVNKEGPLAIGPVSINNITSNSVNIVVRKPTELDFTEDSNNDDDEDGQQVQNHESLSPHPQMHALIHAPQKNAYVGEPFIISRLVYYRGNIRKSEFEDLSSSQAFIKKLPGTLERTEVIKGREYRVVEEKYLVTPSKAGTMTISPQRFIYLYMPNQPKKNRDPFQMFFQAFSPFELHQDQGVVPEVNFTIKPLPEHIKNIDAVGTFTDYELTIEPSKISVHDTAQIKLRLKGFGNFDDIATPHIQLPSFCNSYAPTQKMLQEISTNNKQGIKEFRFVMQPTQAGDLIIPSQIFSFFNPHTETVETIQTKEIICSVQPKEDIAQSTQSSTTKNNNDHDTKNNIASSDVDNQKKESNKITWDFRPLNSKKIPTIPWILFFLALLTPLLAVRQKIYYYLTGKNKKNVKAELIDELEQAITQKQYGHAHKIIKKLFGLISNKPESFITETMIEQILTEQGCYISDINAVKDVYIQTLVNNSQKTLHPQQVEKTMNLFKKLCLLLLIAVQLGHAAPDAVENGLALVQSGEFKDAYRVLSTSSEKNPLILKTIADLAYKLEKNHDALFWYTAAQRKLALSEIKNHTYIIAQKQALYHVINPTISSSKKMLLLIRDICTSIPLSLWQVLFLLIWIICGIQILRKNNSKIDVLVYALALLSSGALLFYNFTIHQHEQALTFNGTTRMHSGPDTTYDVITELPQQSICSIVKQGEYFYKIKNKHHIGWISKKDLLLP